MLRSARFAQRSLQFTRQPQMRAVVLQAQQREMGMFSDFIANVKKGFSESEQMKEATEEIKEKTKENIEALQKTKEKTTEAITPAAQKTAEVAKASYEKIVDISGKVAETEAAKKTVDLTKKAAQKTVEGATKVGEEASKSIVYQQAAKGAGFLKKELVDDSVLAAAKYHPYQSPDENIKEKVMKSTQTDDGIIEENVDAQDLVMHKHSKWEIEWQNFKDNNAVLNRAYEWKMNYDESDNIFVRAIRSVTDKFAEASESLSGGNDVIQVLTEIRKLDPTFEKEDFIELAHSELIPLLLESYYNKDQVLLKAWCSEQVYSVIEHVYKAQKDAGLTTTCEIKAITHVDIFNAVMMEQGPVLNCTAMVQQVCVTRNKAGEIVEGDPELVEEVLYFVAFSREEGVYKIGSWRIMDFSMHLRRPVW